MGIVYSFCFGQSPGREEVYRVNEPEDQKTYSWDKREKADPKQFMFDGVVNETRFKLPGQINGQQFIIQNCKQSCLYLFDHSASVTVDDCSDCSILIGPCKGSVFIRDCQNCRFVIACQQFRTRDCRNFDVFLFCQTQPIIEESQKIRFACMQLYYDHIYEQFEAAGLSMFNNRWSNIHDFTPAKGNDQPNHRFLEENITPSTFFNNLQESSNENSIPVVSFDVVKSLVPITLGLRRKPSKQEKCHLICTKELTMQARDLERIIDTQQEKDKAEKVDILIQEHLQIRCVFCRSSALCVPALKYLNLIYESHVDNFPFPFCRNSEEIENRGESSIVSAIENSDSEILIERIEILRLGYRLWWQEERSNEELSNAISDDGTAIADDTSTNHTLHPSSAHSNNDTIADDTSTNHTLHPSSAHSNFIPSPFHSNDTGYGIHYCLRYSDYGIRYSHDTIAQGAHSFTHYIIISLLKLVEKAQRSRLMRMKLPMSGLG